MYQASFSLLQPTGGMGKSDHGVADRKSNLWPPANVTLDRTTPFNVTAHKRFSAVCRED
ncbi:hypothetical protein SCLCIDRAFT_1224254 [Scleroderma citrinum Foug A]|uniref:Uncharacterized protein n=1 Tax=Scleroderma citrinum Foug A TaxID=1036808 RepID=A0A0C2YPP1_9AGAM|nr:hypothetical protein SCLCIDRAFT_1224254 [Scleroderma citrinum Foug A]